MVFAFFERGDGRSVGVPNLAALVEERAVEIGDEQSLVQLNPAPSAG